MACEYCGWVGYHHSQCPNYESSKSHYNCSECGENIAIGEEYVENDVGDCAHWECIDFARDLAKFLGYEIKEMESDDY